jgi:hypothetical protein
MKERKWRADGIKPLKKLLRSRQVDEMQVELMEAGCDY